MSIEKARVRDLMTAHPATLSPSDTLDIAKSVMRLGRIRHLPVVDDEDKVMGVVSDHDLAGGALMRASGMDPAMEKRVLERLTVNDVMSNCVLTISPDASLEEAANMMNRNKISCLPVVEDSTLVGLLTERDFVVALVNLTEEEKQEEAAEEPRPAGDWTWRTMEEEFDRLRAIRDELKVQLRLATMEAKEGFEEAEKRWSEIEQGLKSLRDVSGESVEDAVRIGQNFVHQTRMIYDDLRGKLDS